MRLGGGRVTNLTALRVFIIQCVYCIPFLGRTRVGYLNYVKLFYQYNYVLNFNSSLADKNNEQCEFNVQGNTKKNG